jgi:hypothetical protein
MKELSSSEGINGTTGMSKSFFTLFPLKLLPTFNLNYFSFLRSQVYHISIFVHSSKNWRSPKPLDTV